MTPLERILNMIQALGDIEERWDYLYEEIHKKDLEQSDLLHEIESNNFNAYQGYLKAKELQQLRQRRRELKNEQAQLKPIYEFYTRNKNVLIELYKIKSNIEKTKEQQENWIYNKRIEETF